MLVTVYITTFNRITLLKRAIESVLAQTYDNIEIIVADDGSTDGSQSYLEQLASEGKLKAFLNTTGESKGACYGRNKAIFEASGKFITGLDDDDYFEPWRVSTFVKYWHDYTNQNKTFSALFDSVVEHRSYGKVDCYDTKIVSNKDLRTGNLVGNQVFTLTERARSINGFDELMPALQDWDTWIRLSAKHGDILNINSRSYIQIQDHGGTRITSKPAEKIRFAFNRLQSKLAPLSKKEKRKFLAIMYSGYQQIDLRLSELTEILLGGYIRLILQILKRTVLKAK